MNDASRDDERAPGGPQAFRPVPRTGVIYVMTEAAAAGYRPDDPAWANLGQGQPETGPLPGAPPRIFLNHGEDEARKALAAALADSGSVRATLPLAGESHPW